MGEHFVLYKRHAKNGHGNLVLCQIQDMMSEYLPYYFHDFGMIIY